MIRSAQDVIAVARSRGLDVQIRPGPPRMPVLVRPKNVDKSLVTDTLLVALKAWWWEIVEVLDSEAMNKVAHNP
jgi:hypothetical protein